MKHGQKNEIVLKENRHEDSARNQNGRLYKERGSDAGIYGSYASHTPTKQWELVKLITMSTLIVLLTSTRNLFLLLLPLSSTNDSNQRSSNNDRERRKTKSHLNINAS
uniref:Uncharacterized protein n=1 Tax=Glossina austeni TaxID=7395 RepID=A0A1A9UUS6_GLOAU